jgi:SAM-dependent methyltransferase
MDLETIRTHWTNWASEYGSNLRATTKTWTAKAIELDALTRRLSPIIGNSSATILEVGCGNGVNCIHLAKTFQNALLDGVDLIPEMIEAARTSGTTEGISRRTSFLVGDVLNLHNVNGLRDYYDVVFTDRCLINLNTVELQKTGISSLAKRVKDGGHLVMIENSKTTYATQNESRAALGLPPRTPAEFNLFFDEEEILHHISTLGFDLIETDDFSSLHDLALYVLAPAINDGKLDYEHPLVHAATRLSLSRPTECGAYGQNRMFVCRRK